MMKILKKRGLKAYKGIFKPILSGEAIAFRLEWCLARRTWTLEIWKQYAFTDECGMHETGHRQVYFIRRPN